MISKEDALFKTRPASTKWISSCVGISLFSKSSWIKTTASSLSYELGINDEKKLMEAGILLIKVDIAHFALVNLEILTV